MEAKLRVTEIQRFCMRDGPGVRTTVFLKGCPLRCAWCHNPEGQRAEGELLFYANRCIECRLCLKACPRGAHSFAEGHRIDRTACVLCGACARECPTAALSLCGREYTVDELMREIEKDRAFFENGGGVTRSGGEPLMQGEAVIRLLKACKSRGISTALETCGYVGEDTLRASIPLVDLFLWDVKDTDSQRHRRYTGVGCEEILDRLALADSLGARTRLRCILVHGINTHAEHYGRVAELLSSLRHCEGVDWIPYHAYGGGKATFLGREDNGRTEWIPTAKEIEEAESMTKNFRRKDEE